MTLIPVQKRVKEITEELKFKGANKKLIREARKYYVNVHENLFRKIYDTGVFVGASEELREDFFVLKDCSSYSNEAGLQVKAELRMDIWLQSIGESWDGSGFYGGSIRVFR